MFNTCGESGLNLAYSNNWKFEISDFPFICPPDNLSSEKLGYFNNFVGAIDPPGGAIDVISDTAYSYTRNEAATMRDTIGLHPLGVTYKCTDNAFNWLAAMNWLMRLRTGNIPSGRSNDYKIQKGILSILDNDKQTIGRLIYGQLLLENVTKLGFLYGSSDVLSFDMTFRYESVDIDL